MLKAMKNLNTVLTDMIQKEITDTKGIDIFEVVNINEDQTYNIKKLNIAVSYNNVQAIGVGLGKGKIKHYNAGDLVIATFITNSTNLVILGSIYDNISRTKDTKIQVEDNEYFVNNQANGAFIFMDKNNNIIIRTPDGAKLKLNNDGSFKLFDHTNRGIEMDTNSAMKIRSLDLDFPDDPGTW